MSEVTQDISLDLEKPNSCGHWERCVPGETEEITTRFHVARYEYAAHYVAGKEVLDVACGTGYGGPILCGAGAKSYLGIDINEEVVSLAEARYASAGGMRFLQDDASSLSTVRDGTIDTAVSFETIEHVNDAVLFLSQLRRVLRPGGLLVISTPNRTLYSPGKSLTSKPGNPFHVREWNQQEFLRLLTGPFEIEEVRGQGFKPLWKTIVIGQAAKKPWLHRIVYGYVNGKARLAQSTVNPQAFYTQDPQKVAPIGRRLVPTYIVCLARRLAG